MPFYQGFYSKLFTIYIYFTRNCWKITGKFQNDLSDYWLERYMNVKILICKWETNSVAFTEKYLNLELTVSTKANCCNEWNVMMWSLHPFEFQSNCEKCFLSLSSFSCWIWLHTLCDRLLLLNIQCTKICYTATISVNELILIHFLLQMHSFQSFLK